MPHLAGPGLVALIALVAPVTLALTACEGGPSPEGDSAQTPGAAGASGATASPPGMTLVPGRELVMGTDSAGLQALAERYGMRRTFLFEAEAPARTVEVDSFHLDVDDVTNAEFAEFVEAHPEWSRAGIDPAGHDGEYLSHWAPDGPFAADRERPVTFITWAAADAYCRWRDARLPTEAEWELAAGGGEATREFPWGDAMPHDSLVVWGESDVEKPEPVGSRPPTLHGLHDMSGNVWHLLADAWPASPDAEPSEPRRAIRGGSFEAAAVNLRVRYRDSHREHDAAATVGFRCARDAAHPGRDLP